MQAQDPDVRQVQGNRESLLEELSVERTPGYHSNIPLVQIPMQTYEESHKRNEQHQCSSSQKVVSSNADYNRHCLTSQQSHTISGESCSMEVPTANPDATASLPFICQTCLKSFSSAAKLRRHHAIHQSRTTKTFTCQYCARQFRTRKLWKIHETFHENTQAYTCEICLKSFTHPSNLKRHQQLHVGAREYRCDTCGKRFTRHTHLCMHQRVHTGEKPYECPKCGRCFSTSSGLAKHGRTVACIIQVTVNDNGPQGT